MRAVVHDRYGPPEVLRLDDVERPVPKDDEILVEVHATTVNRTDCGVRAAIRSSSRVFTGFCRPKRKILGMRARRRGRGVRRQPSTSSRSATGSSASRVRCTRGVRLRPRERGRSRT